MEDTRATRQSTQHPAALKAPHTPQTSRQAVTTKNPRLRSNLGLVLGWYRRLWTVPQVAKPGPRNQAECYGPLGFCQLRAMADAASAGQSRPPTRAGFDPQGKRATSAACFRAGHCIFLHGCNGAQACEDHEPPRETGATGHMSPPGHPSSATTCSGQGSAQARSSLGHAQGGVVHGVKVFNSVVQ